MVNENPKPRVMILGTFHMRQTPDLEGVDLHSISNLEKQNEIKAVLMAIQKFNPTKIAVEVVKENQAALNEEYHQFLHGELALEVNEVHQFGFRAAAELHHENVYAVDWMGNGSNRGLGSVFEWARTEKPELYKQLNEYYRPKLEFPEEENIFNLIQMCNDPRRNKLDHEMYLAVGRLQKETEYIGLDWLSWWYQRNLTIYSNIAEITKESSDRTLLIIGSAHVHLLTQFLKESGLYEVGAANEYIYE
ncbi:DUF5694 domain-containing protein [Virgibacillus halodenitrificans]|uniref:DUF5694 domain-containing protein n=1 Tax=Virgibacillus halodenitrificans TaxID=1482 RepID=UPI000761932D|nr:DUF5694 domain-containing protein [Virgibacillus halodenitrificans]MEC2158806.1 DUF5694 domain-containing protein [Virgibacillus halodenitrificans]